MVGDQCTVDSPPTRNKIIENNRYVNIIQCYRKILLSVKESPSLKYDNRDEERRKYKKNRSL